MGVPEALVAFRERRWRDVRQQCARARLPLAKLLSAWAALELGEAIDTVGLREAIEASDEFALHNTWGLWPFRKRAGVDRLVEWGLYDLLLSRCWASFGGELSTASIFTTEWVSPELLAFWRWFGSSARPPTPWQLGSAAPVLDRDGATAVTGWALAQLASSPSTPLEIKEALAAPDPSAALLKLPRTGEPASAAVAAATRGESTERVLSALGNALLAEPREVVVERFRQLDHLLLVEDLAARLRTQAQSAAIEAVLFRETPRRALDVAIARLNGGRFGTLARYLERGMPGEVWTVGTIDEALAAVPEAHFAKAVAALKG